MMKAMKAALLHPSLLLTGLLCVGLPLISAAGFTSKQQELLATFGTSVPVDKPEFWQQTQQQLRNEFEGHWTKELDRGGKVIYRIYHLKDAKFFGDPAITMLLTFQDDVLVEFKFDYWNKGDGKPGLDEKAKEQMQEILNQFKSAGMRINKSRTMVNRITRVMETRYTIDTGVSQISFIPQKEEYYSILLESKAYLAAQAAAAKEAEKKSTKDIRKEKEEKVIRLVDDTAIEAYKKQMTEKRAKRFKDGDKRVSSVAGGGFENVKQGDVFLNVPMIDQGGKGYCAPATLTRILLYYGKEADVNELAKIMKTGDGGGTYEPDIREAVRDTARRMKLSFRWERRFRYRTIERYINKGVPMFWLIPGHICLIIGYNEDSEEILFSDSWGYEGYRRASEIQAEKMTEGLYVIK